MRKLDLRNDLKYLYTPSAKEAQVVDVPGFRFLMVDGAADGGGEPGASPAFQQAVGALYGVAYTLKFAAKKRAENPVDYPVMPLEGLWWSAGGRLDLARKEEWCWTLMILQPPCTTPEMVADAVEAVRRKGENPALERLRLESFCEGTCAQIMHVGPYSEEGPTIERLHAFARENGYALRGKHHEIYLGDPRRADPAKLKTILRQPVTC